MASLPNSRTLRHRAEECRTLAESFRHKETRDKMLQVAAEYEAMANRAKELEIAISETKSAIDPSKALVEQMTLGK